MGTSSPHSRTSALCIRVASILSLSKAMRSSLSLVLACIWGNCYKVSLHQGLAYQLARVCATRPAAVVLPSPAIVNS